MTQRKTSLVVDVIIILLLLIPAGVTAQDRTAGSYPDIEVTNNILKELLKDVYGEDRLSIDVSGSYLPGYGLLFVVTPQGGFFEPGFISGNLPHAILLKAFDSAMAQYDSAMAQYDLQMAKHDSAMARFDSSMKKHQFVIPRVRPLVSPPMLLKEGNKHSIKKFSEKLDKKVMTFLESYADAENKLSPGEKISVVVFLEEDSRSQARLYEVSKNNVADYRTNVTSETMFKQQVKISNVSEKGEDNSIDIMATILDKSIGGRSSNENRIMPGGNSRGMYLKGLGAFFICRLTGFPSMGDLVYTKESRKVNVAQFKKRVIQTLGNYGSSLRFLPKNESVYVLLSADSFGARDEEVLIGLKMKDIELYSRNEIDYDALQRRATTIQN